MAVKGPRESRCARRFIIMQNQSLSWLVQAPKDAFRSPPSSHSPPPSVLSQDTASPPSSRVRLCTPPHLTLSLSMKGSRSLSPSILPFSLSLNWFLPIDLRSRQSLLSPKPFLDSTFSSASTLPPSFLSQGYSRGQAVLPTSSLDTHPLPLPSCPPHSS